MDYLEATVSHFDKLLDNGRIQPSVPARSGKDGYAEHYGRCIHFLLAYEEVFGEPLVYDLAIDLGDEAVEFLYAQDMFRGHPGEDRYDALGGVGFLLLALMHLHTDSIPLYERGR